ncbi:MAG: Hsp20/alpha crystallin family protein [Bacteroidota bacterium]
MSDFTIDIERQLSQLGQDIQQFVERIVPLTDESRDFAPHCDIIEGDEAYKIMLDLPGLTKNEITISLKERVLSVKGQRSTTLADDEVFRRTERKSGAFARSFALPEHVDAGEVQARFEHGVLTITMAKRESDEDSTSIPIS